MYSGYVPVRDPHWRPTTRIPMDQPSPAMTKADYKTNRGSAYTEKAWTKYTKKKAKEIAAWERQNSSPTDTRFGADMPEERQSEQQVFQLIDGHGRIPGGEIHRLDLKFRDNPQGLQRARLAYLKNVRKDAGLKMGDVRETGLKGLRADNTGKQELLREMIVKRATELMGR